MSTNISGKFGNKSLVAAHLGATIAVSIWGVSFVSTKVLLDHGMGPIEVYIYRFVIAYLLILAISHKQFRSFSWRDEGIFLLCGLSSGSLYFIAENTALQYTLVTNVSLLTSTSPLLTTLLVGLLYKSQRPNAGIYIGSVIAFVGVACVIFNSSASLEVRPLGDFLSLAAALCWAVYGLLIKALNTNYDIWFITRKTFFYGIVTSLPLWLIRETPNNPMVLLSDPAVLGNLLFLGVGASLIAFLLWTLCVKRLGAITANNYMYLQTVVTMIFSAIILSERITIVGYIGCATIIFGLWIGDYMSRRIESRR